MKHKKQKVELTVREVALLLKYACPFPEHADLLRASQPREGWHTVDIDAYWVSHWVGDLVHSARSIRSRSLLEEIDGLCATLENAATRDHTLQSWD